MLNEEPKQSKSGEQRPDLCGMAKSAAGACKWVRCQHYQVREAIRGEVVWNILMCTRTNDNDNTEPGTTAVAGSIKPSTDGLSPGSRYRVDWTFPNSTLSSTRDNSKPSDTLRERSCLRDAQCKVQPM